MTMKRNDRNIDAASLDLEAIKARAAAATEGPWEAATCHESEQGTRSECVRGALLEPDAPASGLWMTWKPDSPLGVHLTAVTGDGPHGEADAEFIAHAREDIPALLDEVERLRAQPAITDGMVERGALAMHRITCDTDWHECSHAGPAGCMAIARQVVEAALGGEQR